MFQSGKRKSNLAWSEVKRGWGHSRCCREDLLWWLEVVASTEVGEKRGKVGSVEEKKKLEKKIVFLPTLHTDFFLFRKWNPLLFIRYGIRACYLY
jgi:hypothetical protein